MTRGARFWLQAGLAILGLIVSTYLTLYHYFSAIPLVCPATQVIDCGAVLASKYAVLAFNVPSSVLGIAFFVVELLLLFYIKNSEEVKLYWNVIGFISLFYFWFAEYEIGKICIYCTLIHIIVISLLIITFLESKKK